MKPITTREKQACFAVAIDLIRHDTTPQQALQVLRARARYELGLPANGH